MSESTAIFIVEEAGQGYNQTDEFVCLGGNVNRNADASIEVNRRIRNAWCSFRKYTLEMYDRPSAPLELRTLMLRAEVRRTFFSPFLMVFFYLVTTGWIFESAYVRIEPISQSRCICMYRASSVSMYEHQKYIPYV